MNVGPATPSDRAAIAELFGAADEAVLGRPSRIDEETVDGWLQTIAWETNTWLVEDGGALVAGAFAQVFDGTGNSAGAVRPTARGRGLGSRLLDLVEGRMREEGAGRLHSWTVAGDTAAEQLLPARGFREVRRFWEMGIELDGETPEPAAAADVFREEDGPAFHAALEEAFADHWEHKPETFAHWWSRQQSRSNFDPSLWFLIRDGGEVAAACRNEERSNGGYVGALGVRTAWRGKGYGRALLQHSFREFGSRGHAYASLGVDASNATGATHLYESVGMHVEEEHVVWEKALA